MYNVNQILDRTFDNWGTMLGANEYSFWAISEIEMKPTQMNTSGMQTTPETEPSTTTSPTETQEWEPADTKEWTHESSGVARATSVDTETADPTDAMSATLENLTDTARDVFEEFNPFRDPEENS